MHSRRTNSLMQMFLGKSCELVIIAHLAKHAHAIQAAMLCSFRMTNDDERQRESVVERSLSSFETFCNATREGNCGTESKCDNRRFGDGSHVLDVLAVLCHGQACILRNFHGNRRPKSKAQNTACFSAPRRCPSNLTVPDQNLCHNDGLYLKISKIGTGSHE